MVQALSLFLSCFLVLVLGNQTACCNRYCGNNNLNIPWEAFQSDVSPTISTLFFRYSAYSISNLTTLNQTTIQVVPGDSVWIYNAAGLDGTSGQTAFKVRAQSASSSYFYWLVPKPIPIILQTASRLSNQANELPRTGENFVLPIATSGQWVVTIQGFANPGDDFWRDLQIPDVTASFIVNAVVPPSTPIRIQLGTLDWTSNLVGVNSSTRADGLREIVVPLDGDVTFVNAAADVRFIQKNLSHPLMAASGATWNNAQVQPATVRTVEQMQNTPGGAKFFSTTRIWVLYEVASAGGSRTPDYAIRVVFPFIFNRTGIIGVRADAPECARPPPTSASTSGFLGASSSSSFDSIPLTISLLGIALPMLILYCVVPCVYICCKNKTKL